jgi:UDP-N-acetylmuramyl tripeptide synthase
MMLDLCIEDLNRIVGGDVALGLMPPLAGRLEPIRRLVVDSSVARPGDVYWALCGPGFDGAMTAEEAYARGALGVVVSSRQVEPWAGKFALRVANTNHALTVLAEYEQVRRSARRQRPLAIERGDSTSLVAAMLHGAAVSVEELIEQVARRRSCMAL